jgi:hypothetical protein
MMSIWRRAWSDYDHCRRMFGTDMLRRIIAPDVIANQPEDLMKKR